MLHALFEIIRIKNIKNLDQLSCKKVIWTSVITEAVLSIEKHITSQYLNVLSIGKTSVAMET